MLSLVIELLGVLNGWLVMALGGELDLVFIVYCGALCFPPRFDGLVKEHMDKVDDFYTC